MAWTTPRTWVYNEVVTAALFNAQLRDNEGIISTAINSNGKVRGLSSTYLANLSGANLEGVPQNADDQEYTGQNDYSGGKVVVPVGTDLYVDDGGTKRAGSMWVEGTYLHYVDSTNSEWRIQGTYLSSPSTPKNGSVWVDSATGYVHYIDASGDERYCYRSSSGLHGDAGATPGSMWAESADDYLHFIAWSGTTEYKIHNDVAHGDGTSHTDSHNNTAHTDSHGDIAHVDIHTDWYSDGGYGDAHHTDHADSHGDSYSDTAHTNTYSDVAHANHTNSYSDYTDTAHVDLPEEIGV